MYVVEKINPGGGIISTFCASEKEAHEWTNTARMLGDQARFYELVPGKDVVAPPFSLPISATPRHRDNFNHSARGVGELGE